MLFDWYFSISPDFNQKSIIQISPTTSPKSPWRTPGENVAGSPDLRDIVGIEFGRLPQVPAGRGKGPVETE